MMSKKTPDGSKSRNIFSKFKGREKAGTNTSSKGSPCLEHREGGRTRPPQHIPIDQLVKNPYLLIDSSHTRSLDIVKHPSEYKQPGAVCRSSHEI